MFSFPGDASKKMNNSLFYEKQSFSLKCVFKARQTTKMFGNMSKEDSFKINPDGGRFNIFYHESEPGEGVPSAFMCLIHHEKPSYRNKNEKACTKYHADEALVKTYGTVSMLH